MDKKSGTDVATLRTSPYLETGNWYQVPNKFNAMEPYLDKLLQKKNNDNKK